LFNQPRPLRPAKPWQASGYLRSPQHEPAFDAARWNDKPLHTYADSAMPARSTGFAADSYQPMSQPLSEQAKKALARLEEEHRQERLAQEKDASEDGSSTNEHLPFVPDVYESVVPTSAKRAAAPAAASAVAEPEPEQPLPPDMAAGSDVVPPLEDAHAEQAPDAHPSESAQEESIAAAEPAQDDTPEEAMADDDALTASAAEAEAEPAPAVEITQAPAVEEPRLEEPSAQAQDTPTDAPSAETLVMDASALDELAAQKLAEGLAQGLEQGMTQGHAQGLAEGLEKGLAQGIAQGEAQAREAMAAEVAAQCALLEQVTHDLKALMANPTQFFEPLKRLSVHLAEQLVLGELSLSSKAVERLIQHCLDEVSHPLQDGVVVELHPDDKKRLQAQGGDFLQGMRLEAMPEMQRGSVRVFANDMVVEDLVEHRLSALAKNLLADVPGWQKQSVLAPMPPTTETTEHDDDPA